MIVTVTDLYDGVTPETSPVTISVIEGSATPGGGGGAVDSVNGHVGVVVLDADDLADGTTNHVFTAADDTKLAGIATGATANSSDATLLARANHTGTQAIATVTGLQAALDGKDTALASHEADTTNVHGITDTSALETTTGSAAKVAAHAGLSDPHPGYLTPAEGNAAYDAIGAASSAQAAAISAAATDATTKANAAQAASQPLDSDLATIAGLDSTTAGALTTDGSGWIRKTYAQLKTALSLVKADVGLGSVDNTADTAKPVSTAQQTALDLKANLASPTFTGNPAAPTASPGDNDTSIATTAFVTAAVAAGSGSGAGPPNFAISAWTTPDSNTGFNDTGTDGSYWLSGWRASTTAAQNDKVGWNILLNAGTYNFEFAHLKASGSGIGNVYLAGVLIGTFDAYAAGATANNRSTISAVVVASGGSKLLEIRMATKNASSSAYGLLLHGFMVRQTA